MGPTEMIDAFFNLEEEIHKFFKYKEDWKKIPIVDQRKYYWHLAQVEDGSGEVTFHEQPFTKEILSTGHIIKTQSTRKDSCLSGSIAQNITR